MRLKPSLKDFEHYVGSMWNECNFVVVWTFFTIALLWDWIRCLKYFTIKRVIILTWVILTISTRASLVAQFSSVTQLCPTVCNPMNCSMPGLLVHHQLLEFTPTRVHWVGDGIQPSHPLSSPSPPALNLSQHHGLFKWVNSSHQVARVLEFQLQHQSFQWTPRTDLV